jgi:hypothetical protein
MGVYARRYRADGTRQGPVFRVNQTAAGSQASADIATLNNDGFVVVWSSFGQDGNGNGVYGQRFRADGTRAGREFKVNTRTAGHQQRASVAGLADGGFVVVWESLNRDATRRIGIFGQRFANSGERLGPEFKVNTAAVGDPESPDVTGLETGGFVVVWHSPSDPDGLDIYGQRFNANGTRSGGAFRLNSRTADHQNNAAVAPWGDNGFVAVWNSPDSANGDGVRGQRFDAQGRVGPEFRVNTTLADFQVNAAVAPLGNGGFIVVWESFGVGGDTTDEADVFGQRYAANGERVGPEFRINTRRAADQSQPAVAAVGNRGFIVVWESFGQDGSDYGVFGQRYGN